MVTLPTLGNCAMYSASCCYVVYGDGGDSEVISDNTCVVENCKSPRTTHILSGGHFSPCTVYMANDDDAALLQGLAWDDTEFQYSRMFLWISNM